MASRRLSVPLLLLVGFFFAAPSVFSRARNLKKIQVGVPAVSMGNIIIFFTKEAKLFEKHGLDADVVVVNGSGIASRALVAGSVAISPIATPAVISAVLAGSDMFFLMHPLPPIIPLLLDTTHIHPTDA